MTEGDKPVRGFTVKTKARDLGRMVTLAAAIEASENASVLDLVCREIGPRGALVVTPDGRVVEVLMS
jgi:hypothetical protein